MLFFIAIVLHGCADHHVRNNACSERPTCRQVRHQGGEIFAATKCHGQELTKLAGVGMAMLHRPCDIVDVASPL
jgi:hypothetical protein